MDEIPQTKPACGLLPPWEAALTLGIASLLCALVGTSALKHRAKSRLRLFYSFTHTYTQMHTPIQYPHKHAQSPGLLWEAQTHLTADCHKAQLQPGSV